LKPVPVWVIFNTSFENGREHLTLGHIESLIVMALKIEVSAGEFLDKLTILEIKSQRIQDPAKVKNVRKELQLLHDAWASSQLSHKDISSQLRALKEVNETLWDIEDQIRRKEAEQLFDDQFVQLARSVYQYNDRRADIKRELNRILGSGLVEEKSYPDYKPPAT
jgi:uncharacterized protein YukE